MFFQCMEVCVRDEDTLARLGGDEFMIIVTSIKAASALETVARKVLDVFNTSFVVSPYTFLPRRKNSAA